MTTQMNDYSILLHPTGLFRPEKTVPMKIVTFHTISVASLQQIGVRKVFRAQWIFPNPGWSTLCESHSISTAMEMVDLNFPHYNDISESVDTGTNCTTSASKAKIQKYTIQWSCSSNIYEIQLKRLLTKSTVTLTATYTESNESHQSYSTLEAFVDPCGMLKNFCVAAIRDYSISIQLDWFVRSLDESCNNRNGSEFIHL